MSTSSRATVAILCARGGSKGIPRKNLRPLCGKPLIVWSIEVALSASSIDRVLVSTDDPEIASVAAAAGATVPFIRPAELATDGASEWQVWQHLFRDPESRVAVDDYFVSVSPTAPLRQVEDLERAIQIVHRGEGQMVVGVTEARRHPVYNLLKLDSDGLATPYVESSGFTRRQDCPPAYDLTTVVYAGVVSYVLEHNSLFHGKVKTIEIPPERAVDIDTEFDFEIAECLMRKRLGS